MSIIPVPNKKTRGNKEHSWWVSQDNMMVEEIIQFLLRPTNKVENHILIQVVKIYFK